MPNQLVRHAARAILCLALVASGSALRAQGPVERGRADALAAVGQVMALRIGAFGDSLAFDACSVFAQTGRRSDFPAGLPPGLLPLLDRADADPCAPNQAHGRAGLTRTVRVDSVVVTDSSASVHLSIRRGEWSYNEDHYFAALPNGRGWGFREIRITHPFRVTPPPPISLDGRRRGAPAGPPPLTFINGERVLIDTTGRATPPCGVKLVLTIPEDIERIEVLPRGEAVERYGPDGAAGVVLITTRSRRVP